MGKLGDKEIWGRGMWMGIFDRAKNVCQGPRILKLSFTDRKSISGNSNLSLEEGIVLGLLTYCLR